MERSRNPELTECRECESEFALARQNYYDNICPSCLEEEGEAERTWPTCVECDDKIPPDERASKTVRGAARDPATVSLPVHERCKPERGRGPKHPPV